VPKKIVKTYELI